MRRSESIRLIAGYLQEQKCDEAAKVFMDTSPLLHECRIVTQRGGRYSTKVGGLSLSDILDKYCTANAMSECFPVDLALSVSLFCNRILLLDVFVVQEKLSRGSECEPLKQCNNDLVEQLRYLLEGSRGNRFVVNISVPPQVLFHPCCSSWKVVVQISEFDD